MLGREAKRKIKDVFILGNVAYESEYLALYEHDPSSVDMDGANADCLVPKVFTKNERVDLKSNAKRNANRLQQIPLG